MSQRKNSNPAFALTRFIHSLFSYYRDKGMPTETAKARMYKETYGACYDFFKQEKDIPDHALVIAMQSASKLLNKRGADMAKKLELTKTNAEIDSLRKELMHIKTAKEQVDHFITSYQGE